jgi:hypothetical protein
LIRVGLQLHPDDGGLAALIALDARRAATHVFDGHSGVFSGAKTAQVMRSRNGADAGRNLAAMQALEENFAFAAFDHKAFDALGQLQKFIAGFVEFFR